MTLTAGSFRFARREGMYYAFGYKVRGRWRKTWLFAESQEAAEARAIKELPLLAGGNVSAVRRADTRAVIWTRAA